MSKKLQSTLELLESNPDVKAYIYQQIVDFNPFVSPETKVTVLARDPNKNHRIAVVLTEDGASIEAEGEHQDIFMAITLAKENLIQKLIEIQDSAITSQERQMAINEALQNTLVH